MRQSLAYILVFSFILLLSAPLVFELWLDKGDIKPLKGTFRKAKPMKLNWDNWVNKEWQQRQEEIVKKNLKIKPSVVRLQHEMDYQLFDVYHMGDLLVGKDGYYFSWGWADKRCCVNTLDQDSTRIFVKKLKKLSNLYRKKGKYMRVIIVPSKEEIFSDKLPDEYAYDNPDNDYRRYKKLLDEYKVEYWDLLEFYRGIMDTASHPIYSPTSVHWTKYGTSFTIFKLLDDMDAFFGNRMNQLTVEGRKLSQFVHKDGDTEATLNLLSRIDTSSNFMYLDYGVKRKENAFRPKVITIGDSYYGNIRECEMLPEIYADHSKFLYYYSKVHLIHNNKTKRVKDLNIENEFKKADAFILLNSSHNLKNFPFGFQYDIDKVIKALESQ
ncbi:MAG: hypothetical protein CMP59_09165 [Flavobacteriales bacterium]|nr:hypothetical protein [Flavobacteriales bacterium]